jgi:hypothetical protein
MFSASIVPKSVGVGDGLDIGVAVESVLGAIFNIADKGRRFIIPAIISVQSLSRGKRAGTGISRSPSAPGRRLRIGCKILTGPTGPPTSNLVAEIHLASSKTQKRVTESAVEQTAPHQRVEPQRLFQVRRFRGIRVPVPRLH